MTWTGFTLYRMWSTGWILSHSASFGPYYVAGFLPSQELDLKWNPNYFGPKPYFTQIVIKAGEALLSFKVDSWQNGVNRNVAGRSVRRVLGYNGNGAHFRRVTDEVAKGGYQEFAFR